MTDGRAYVYILPCTWEDHCKVGFSRDPLSRLQDLHRRWFEVFDVHGMALVEAETVRDARDIELALRRPLRDHRAPPPSTVREQAGGRTEWLRGALAPLDASVAGLHARGHTVHRPAVDWLRRALLARSDQLYSWSLAQLAPAGLLDIVQPSQDVHGAPNVTGRLVRDTLDAYVMFGIDIAPLVAGPVLAWHRKAVTGGSPAGS